MKFSEIFRNDILQSNSKELPLLEEIMIESKIEDSDL